MSVQSSESNELPNYHLPTVRWTALRPQATQQSLRDGGGFSAICGQLSFGLLFGSAQVQGGLENIKALLEKEN
jgi:hypothetical protein